MEKTFLIPAMGLYLLSAVLYLTPLRRAGIGFFVLGTGLNLTAVLYRGFTAGHLPFSNMFETMMTLGACMFPFFLITELALKSRSGWIDAFLAAVILFPACFFFEDRIKPLPPALQSNLFLPHVMTYLLTYAALAKGMILSVVTLIHRRWGDWEPVEKVAYRMTAMGFPLLTAGLLLGAVWAQRAWGDYWSWDPKEVWSLNTWLIYLIYFHVRMRVKRPSWWCDLLNILGSLAIVVALLAVNLAGIFGGGLHSYA
ncbi:MAG: cytochrome c biogenesis protein CcsA [Planctomycetota bacterium]|jgi:ABC-type transport system involved in cytochrome c biogenesis permease subunit